MIKIGLLIWQGFSVFDYVSIFLLVNHKNKKSMAKIFTRKTINVSDNVYAESIKNVCEVFGAVIEPHKCGVQVPNNVDYMVWCPDSNNNEWSNIIDKNRETIYEYYKNDERKRTKHVNEWIKCPKLKRITFLKENNNGFCFVGIFKINVKKSQLSNMCVWELVESSYKLPTNIATNNLYIP
ncbi:MAG: hypothetical protein Q4Q14_07265 [Methanobrevibacter sp.]|nr:hypothetical protein [Methanobrevibacter sp.]